MTAIRIVLGSLGAALRQPRVWLSLWLLLAVSSLLSTWTPFATTQERLGRHPGAEKLLTQGLDGDLLRQHGASVVPDITGALVFSLLIWIFMGGGILSTVGVRRRFAYGEFLADSARLFPRNLRVVIIGLLPLLALTWGLTLLQGWLENDYLRHSDPGAGIGFAQPFLNLGVLMDLYYCAVAFLVLLLLFASKVARAHLAVHDRSSALVAWSVAAARVLASPLRASLTVVGLTVAYFAAHFLGMGTVYFLEAGLGPQNTGPWIGLAFAQVSAMYNAVVVVAFFVAARKFLAEGSKVGEVSIEPTVSLPSKEPARRPASKATVKV